jgi:hypothetical protein
MPKLGIVPFMLDFVLFRFIFRRLAKISSGFHRLYDKLFRNRKSVAISCWILCLLLYFYFTIGYFNSSNSIDIKNVTIVSEKLPAALDGLKIVQLSDTHFNPFFRDSEIAEVCSLANSLEPDLIAITGDFVNNSVSEFRSEIITILQTLKTRNGNHVYACLGNHDTYVGDGINELKEKINASGIKLLINENKTLLFNGTQLFIAGVDNPGGFSNPQFVKSDLNRALEGVRPELYCILLAHNPNYWTDSVLSDVHDVDLTLSGHTHNGQIVLSIFGYNIFSFASLVYKHVAGLYSEGSQYLYVNTGIGSVGPPIRVGVKPEITLITLKCK